MLRIRNPWGHGEWQMKWSENEDYLAHLESFMPQINEYYEKQKEKILEKNKNLPELERKEIPEPYDPYKRDDKGEIVKDS